MNTGTVIATGVGAGLMYVLDPEQGKRRRALMRDQLVHVSHKIGDAAGVTARDFRNRSRGWMVSLRSSRGRRNGQTQPAQFELLQEHWSPTARLLTAVAGGILALAGASRRSALGAGLAAVGVGMLSRALTNMEMKRLVGIGAGRNAVDVQKTINIDAPLDEVFEFWTNYETFPYFMSRVREVRQTGSNKSHWVVAGPAGVPVEWEAEITEFVPNEQIAWKTVPGSAIAHSGVVKFQPAPDGGTRVEVRMSYNPIAGGVGHLVAALFGADPKAQLDEDLMRMKSMIEAGKTAGQTPTKQW